MPAKKTKPDPVRIGRLNVDLAGLHSLAHNCRPESCRASCCSVYAVHVTDEEMARMVGYMPLAHKYARNLKQGREWRNLFQEEDDGTLLMDTNRDGFCLFCYHLNGFALCSLHSAALDLGQNPAHVKPECCHLWPLALEEGRRDTLTVHDDAFDFPCNRRRTARSGRLHQGVREIVAGLYGDDFLTEVEAACAEWVQKG
jgi:hypothetical protein